MKKYVYGITYTLKMEKVAIARETKKTIMLETWSSAYGKQRLYKDENIAFNEKQAIENKIKEIQNEIDKLERLCNIEQDKLEELRKMKGAK